MFTGPEIVGELTGLGLTHAVWLPDSAFGPWEKSLEESERIELVRVCREGEIWAVCAGLELGGARPIAILQTTGVFESGDALRNVLFDLRIPLFAIIGARSWLVDGSRDTAKQFALPILDAWGIEHRMIESREQTGLLAEHFEHCRERQQPGAVLIAEGRL